MKLVLGEMMILFIKLKKIKKNQDHFLKKVQNLHIITFQLHFLNTEKLIITLNPNFKTPSFKRHKKNYYLLRLITIQY